MDTTVYKFWLGGANVLTKIILDALRREKYKTMPNYAYHEGTAYITFGKNNTACWQSLNKNFGVEDITAAIVNYKECRAVEVSMEKLLSMIDIEGSTISISDKEYYLSDVEEALSKVTPT